MNQKQLLTILSTIIVLSLVPASFASEIPAPTPSVSVVPTTPTVGEETKITCLGYGFEDISLVIFAENGQTLFRKNTTSTTFTFDNTGDYNVSCLVLDNSKASDSHTTITVVEPERTFSMTVSSELILVNEEITITCNIDTGSPDYISILVTPVDTPLYGVLYSDYGNTVSWTTTLDDAIDYIITCQFSVTSIENDMVKHVHVVDPNDSNFSIDVTSNPIVGTPTTITCVDPDNLTWTITMNVQIADHSADPIHSWITSSSEIIVFDDVNEYEIGCYFYSNATGDINYDKVIYKNVIPVLPDIKDNFTITVSINPVTVGQPTEIICNDKDGLSDTLFGIYLYEGVVTSLPTDLDFFNAQDSYLLHTFNETGDFTVTCDYVYNGELVFVETIITVLPVEQTPEEPTMYDFDVIISTNPPIVGELTEITCIDKKSLATSTKLLVYNMITNDELINEFIDNTATITFNTVDIHQIICSFYDEDGVNVMIHGNTVFPIVLEEPVDSNTSVDTTETKKKGGSSNEWKTKPTFGLSYQTFLPIVDGGFTFNGVTHDITDNWHTDFAIQSVTLGEQNTFEARVYAEKNLMVQEFLFGIPEVGESHDAELGVEIWYDYDGVIEEIIIIQETEVVDVSTVSATHSMVKCQSSDSSENCHSTILSMTFLEPLQHDVMAIKAIDFKHRVNITYLNEGFNISGMSLNPMITMMILGTEKYEGTIPITQTAKYSNLWIAEDGREFEINQYGSSKWMNESYERLADIGEPKTRLHSGFAANIIVQQEIAQETMDKLYKSQESVTRDDLFELIKTDQSELINYELPQIIRNIQTECTKLQNDYDARVQLQSQYSYIAKDNNDSMFVESLLDGYPLTQLQEKINICNSVLDDLKI